MKYGLTDKEIDLIKNVFQKFPEVETVFIYGSRAKGNFKKTSDIDLALRFAKGAAGGIANIKSALDDLPLIHEINLLDDSGISSGSFKASYEKTRQIFYRNGQ